MSSPAFATANSSAVLAAAVADAATVVVPYPAGFVQADLTGSTGGQVVVNDNDLYPQGSSGDHVTFAFGASDITITNQSGVTWPAGATLLMSFGARDWADSVEA